MTYQVLLEKGNDSFTITVENVDSVSVENDVYILYDDVDEVMFTAPLQRVIAILKK